MEKKSSSKGPVKLFRRQMTGAVITYSRAPCAQENENIIYQLLIQMKNYFKMVS